MPITESTSVRGHILDCYDHMKEVQRSAATAYADNALPLEHIAGAVYEFNRGASVAALRSAQDAPAAILCSDILENLRQLLMSHFERAVDTDALQEMQYAAREIRNCILQLLVLG